jgi:hypothetical protein
MDGIYKSAPYDADALVWDPTIESVRWWHLVLDENGVYRRRPDGPADDFFNYADWLGQLPVHWIDRAGNLRDNQGNIVFTVQK